MSLHHWHRESLLCMDHDRILCDSSMHSTRRLGELAEIRCNSTVVPFPAASLPWNLSPSGTGRTHINSVPFCMGLKLVQNACQPVKSYVVCVAKRDKPKTTAAPMAQALRPARHACTKREGDRKTDRETKRGEGSKRLYKCMNVHSGTHPTQTHRHTDAQTPSHTLTLSLCDAPSVSAALRQQTLHYACAHHRRCVADLSLQLSAEDWAAARVNEVRVSAHV